jgi:hypothetical protein
VSGCVLIRPAVFWGMLPAARGSRGGGGGGGGAAQRRHGQCETWRRIGSLEGQIGLREGLLHLAVSQIVTVPC